MKTRIEAVAELKRLISTDKEMLVKPQDDDWMITNRGKRLKRSPSAFHVGYVELRLLLDYIYGGPPQSKNE